MGEVRTCQAAACPTQALLDAYATREAAARRAVVEENARLRLRINELEAQIAKEQQPDEEREDGQRVRKNRWEMGIRNIATVLGHDGGPGWEITDLVEQVRDLAVRKGKAKP